MKIDNKSGYCSICLEDYLETNLDAYEIKKCHHKFHKKCISNWIKIKKSCPLCRCSIF